MLQRRTQKILYCLILIRPLIVSLNSNLPKKSKFLMNVTAQLDRQRNKHEMSNMSNHTTRFMIKFKK